MATKKTAEKSAAKAPAKKSASAKTPAKSAGKDKAAPTPAPEATHSPARKAATHQEIAELAHKYHRERGHSHGSHVDDWLRAEKELNS